MPLPKDLRKYTQPRFWYGEANIPHHLQTATLSRFDGHLPEEVVKQARVLVELWHGRESNRGLALFGKPGRGKTSLISAMLCRFITLDMRGATMPGLMSMRPPAYFTTLSQYHDLGYEQMSVEKMLDRAPGDWDRLAQEWTALRERRHWIKRELPVLLLDDVGKEHPTRSGYSEAGFYALMRERFNAGLATSMTSNLTQAEFREAYGEAQLSFLSEACVVFEIKGSDFRRIGA